MEREEREEHVGMQGERISPETRTEDSRWFADDQKCMRRLHSARNSEKAAEKAAPTPGTNVATKMKSIYKSIETATTNEFEHNVRTSKFSSKQDERFRLSLTANMGRRSPLWLHYVRTLRSFRCRSEHTSFYGERDSNSPSCDLPKDHSIEIVESFKTFQPFANLSYHERRRQRPSC
jgi:hypothetical protein